MATETDLGVDANPIFSGEDRTIVFTVKDADDVVEDLTSWAVSFVAGALALTVGAGIVLTTPLSGVLTVTLTAAQTAALNEFTGYKLRRTDTDANTVLAFGNVRVQP